MIHCLQLFSVENNNDICAHIRYDRISLNTSKNYLAALATRVEHKISRAISNPLALVFDGKTTQVEQYVAVLTTFPNENAAGYRASCLTL